MTEKSTKVKTVIDMIIQKMHHFALFKTGNIHTSEDKIGFVIILETLLNIKHVYITYVRSFKHKIKHFFQQSLIDRISSENL